MNHVMKICLAAGLSFVTLGSIAHADDFKLSNNQRISCSRGLSPGKLNTATCRSYAYIFNVKTTEYYRCQVTLALTRDNKEVISVQNDGSCAKRPRIFETDFQLLVRRHRNRATEHQYVFRHRRLCGVGQRQQCAEGPRLHHHRVRPRLRRVEMPRHEVRVIATAESTADLTTPPWPLPERLSFKGRSVRLEPLSPEHAGELWPSAQGADPSFATTISTSMGAPVHGWARPAEGWAKALLRRAHHLT